MNGPDEERSPIKNLLAFTYHLLIVTGSICTVLAFFMQNPELSGIGNAGFLAGFLTPILIKKQMTTEEAIMGGTWTASAYYSLRIGEMNGHAILAVFPMLIVSIMLTRYSRVLDRKDPT